MLKNDLFKDLKNPETVNKTYQSDSSKTHFKNSLSKIWADIYKDSQLSKNPYFSNVKTIKAFMLDKKLHSFLEDLTPPIHTNSNKELILEVTFMTHKREVEKEKSDHPFMLIIQYNFIDAKSGNMIFEKSQQTTLKKSFFAINRD